MQINIGEITKLFNLYSVQKKQSLILNNMH